MLDPTPVVGEISADVETAVACAPISFSASGVSGYPPPSLGWEVLEVGSGEVVSEGTQVQGGFWDTRDVEPGEYYPRVTASNDSGATQVEGEAVTLTALDPDEPLPPECEDGEDDDDGIDDGDGDGDGDNDGDIEPDADGDGDIDADSDSEDIDEGGDGSLDGSVESSSSCGGCSTSGTEGGSLWLLLLAGLLAVRRTCTSQ